MDQVGSKRYYISLVGLIVTIVVLIVELGSFVGTARYQIQELNNRLTAIDTKYSSLEQRYEETQNLIRQLSNQVSYIYGKLHDNYDKEN